MMGITLGGLPLVPRGWARVEAVDRRLRGGVCLRDGDGIGLPGGDHAFCPPLL